MRNWGLRRSTKDERARARGERGGRNCTSILKVNPERDERDVSVRFLFSFLCAPLGIIRFMRSCVLWRDGDCGVGQANAVKCCGAYNIDWVSVGRNGSGGGVYVCVEKYSSGAST